MHKYYAEPNNCDHMLTLEGYRPSAAEDIYCEAFKFQPGAPFFVGYSYEMSRQRGLGTAGTSGPPTR